MVYSLIVACLLLLVGGLLDRTAALARMPRRWVWASALVMTIVLSLAAPWRTFRVGAAPLPGVAFSSGQAAGQVGPAPRTLLDRMRKVWACASK